jgi:hypothetical protein
MRIGLGTGADDRAVPQRGPTHAGSVVFRVRRGQDPIRIAASVKPLIGEVPAADMVDIVEEVVQSSGAPPIICVK